jgi:hypothetical protein
MDIGPLYNYFNERADSLFEGGVLQPLLYAALGAGAMQLAALVKRFNAHSAISKATLDGANTVLGETLYEPTGLINPETGREIFHQKIFNTDHSVNLKDIFHPAIEEELLRYIGKAREYCTETEPMVFQHLDKVMPEKKRDSVKNFITSQWINYFSSKLNDPARSIGASELCPREAWEVKPVLPVLIFEPGAGTKQYRILLIPAWQLQAENFPALEDVRFPVSILKNEFTLDSVHPQSLRLKTHLNIAEGLKKNENLWIGDKTTVQVRTGERKLVPEPRILPLGPREHPTA